MAGLIGSGVDPRGIVSDDFLITLNVTGTVTQANLGNAVVWDTAAANSVKLAPDDGIVAGILESYEDRTNMEGIKIGTVAFKGFFKVPYVLGATSLVPVVGHSVKGSATPGTVKPVAAYAGPNFVTAVDTTTATLTLAII